jgi:hypothetical protein
MVTIVYNSTILAIILPADFTGGGIQFFTPDSFSQQLGYMNRPKGYAVPPHDHNPVPRTIEWTQEALFIRQGRVRLDIYLPETREYFASHILNAGDVALLAHGGHGLVMLEQSEIIEVKQGPYVGEADKARFMPVNETSVKYYTDFRHA